MNKMQTNIISNKKLLITPISQALYMYLFNFDHRTIIVLVRLFLSL
jgi:hypothetical protein